MARHCQQEMANLTRWVKQIDAVQFSAAIAALAQARGVLLLGCATAIRWRCTCAAARVNRCCLRRSRGRTLAEDLAGLTPQDVAVVVAFRRRPRQIKAVLALLQSRGVPTLLI